YTATIQAAPGGGGTPAPTEAADRARSDASLANAPLRPTAGGASARRRPGPDAGSRRAARSRAGDSAQPERPRADHGWQHDGAARAALRPGHGGDGRGRRLRAGHGGVRGPARRRDDQGGAWGLRGLRALPRGLGLRDARIDPV